MTILGLRNTAGKFNKITLFFAFVVLFVIIVVGGLNVFFIEMCDHDWFRH